MMLLTREIRKSLYTNALERAQIGESYNGLDKKPVVKLFDAYGSAFWLLIELEPDGDTAFGLCDLGMGFPELGYVSMKELESLEFMEGVPSIERDLYFTATKPLSEYVADAKNGVRP